MSPVRLRLLLRDLGTGAAFGSMAISGQLPVWAVALFFLALAIALSGKRVFASRPRLTAALLVPVAAVLYLLVAVGQLDLVLAACTFAGLISAQRLLSAPDGATDGQVLLIALLMIAGGAALSADLLFALFLFVFGVLATFSLGLAVVQGQEEAAEPVPAGRVLRPLAVGALLAVVGGVAFFILFPRLSWNVGSRRPSAGLGVATTGFSDTVQLGGSGVLKSNPRVVLRAQFPQGNPGASRLEAYWVGRTYDTFNGREWTSTISPARRAYAPLVERHRGRLQEGASHQRIELLAAYGSRTLIALETPLLLERAERLTSSGTQRISVRELEGEEWRFSESGLGYTYSVRSMQLREGETALELRPQERAQLLALPPGLDPRVAELARQVVGSAREPLEAARRLTAYLQREYAYTLELSGEVEDPLADFLFVRKAGHCEHFATALTLMLRTQGFPARLATGFFGGERVDEATYILRAGDAHAWTHVLVPERGFVTVDATPSANRASQSLQLLAQLITLYEQLEAMWRSSVVEYTFRDQFLFVRDLVRPPREQPESTSSSLPPARAWGAALLVGALVYAAWVFVARRLPSARPLEASRFIDAVERRLASSGLRPREGESLEELSSRLEGEAHPLAPTLTPLTRRYLEARFGSRPLQAGEARSLLRGLEQALERLREQARQMGR